MSEINLCPLAGKCHGVALLCASCGDVSELCDRSGCEVHTPLIALREQFHAAQLRMYDAERIYLEAKKEVNRCAAALYRHKIGAKNAAKGGISNA